MKDLIMLIFALLVISLVSLYLTAKLIAPAYLISAPITVFIFTKPIYLRLREFFWVDRENIFLNSVYPLIIIGCFIAVQFFLPILFMDFPIADKVPENVNYMLLHSTYLLVWYLSFLGLSLFDYYEDGELINKRAEHVESSLYPPTSPTSGFGWTMINIMAIQPIILWIVTTAIVFVPFIIIHWLFLFL
jgi:hypothetical protein